MEQITKEEVIRLHDSKVWENWSDEEIVKFQLFQNRLAVPFSRFHEAVENVLGRPVWTHEFASSNIERIRAEFEGKRGKPTIKEIFDLIPEEKRVLVVMPSHRKEGS